MYVGVICKREGFRRAGRAWPAGPTLAEVTEEEFQQLLADSTFEVHEISEEQFKVHTQGSVDLSIDDGGKANVESQSPDANQSGDKAAGPKGNGAGQAKALGAPKGAAAAKASGDAAG